MIGQVYISSRWCPPTPVTTPPRRQPHYQQAFGLDVGKAEHYAVALDRDGRRVHDKALPNDETTLREVLGNLASRGRVLLVVDQPASIGALPIAVARDLGIDVGYLPGLAMRRLADLHPRQSKTTPATPTSLPTPPARCRTAAPGRAGR